MANMDDDEMTRDEFNRRLKQGRHVELDVAFAQRAEPPYTLSVTHGNAVAAADVNHAAASVQEVSGPLITSAP